MKIPCGSAAPPVRRGATGPARGFLAPAMRSSCDLHGPGPPSGNMSKPKILIVEDDTDIRELLQYSLAREGHEVAVAADGRAALVAARRMLPDLVLLDLMLPGADGLEVCRQLRADRA